MKDHCVLCGNETIYDFTDHIDMRYGYVEGVGQFCISCFKKENSTVQVPVKLINQTPNDQELGNKVRRMSWKNGD